MESIFLLKLFLSIAIGATWSIFITISADKFGSKIGGLISGLPSTIIFSLFFLAWTQSSQFAVSATTIIPAIIGISSLFIVSYIYLSRFNFWFSLCFSLLLWLGLSAILIWLEFDNYVLSVVGYLICFISSVYIVEEIIKVKSAPALKIKYNFKNILFRGVLSGLIIGIAVLVGKLGGPIWGGVFSSFPALFTSTILITYFSQGLSFSIATMKSALLGTISIVIYSVVVRYTFLPIGFVWGTCVAILISFLSGYLIYNFLIKKLS